METKGIEQMLSQLRAVADVASGKPADTASAAGGVDFAQALGAALKGSAAHRTAPTKWRSPSLQVTPTSICRT